MDEKFIETGEATQEAMRLNALALVSSKALPTKVLLPHEYVRYTCIECEDDLPTFRMQKGLTICAPCLTAQEMARKRMRA